jgi:superoxide dismutase, Cu-Zn family
LQVCSVAAIVAASVACGGSQKPDAMTSPAASASSMPLASTSAMPAAPPPAPAASSAPAAPPAAEPPPVVIVSIEPRSGAKLKGTAKFEHTASGVQVTVDVTGAPPGKHGAHIHQNADCSDKEAKSAGDHFNPTMHDHGLPPGEMRHLGDLGNLEVGKDGKGHLEITIAGANLTRGDKMSFMDRGIIIHEKVDSGAQPAGNAGKRIGCGEIK